MGGSAGQSPVEIFPTQRPVYEALLENLASVLSDCDAAGFQVQLKHGIVITKAGYVLPAGGNWVARSLEYTPFSEHNADDSDL